MGIYTIKCSQCQKEFRWFSGNVQDQRCLECKKEPTADDFEAAHNEIARAYLQALLELLFLQKHGELNYVKKAISLPDGGIYVLQLQHVSGPKIDVQKLPACGCKDGGSFACGKYVSNHGNPVGCCECSCHCAAV